MGQTAPTSEEFRSYLGGILSDAGFRAEGWPLVTDMEPVLLAESPYYIVAFQIFDLWNDLWNGVGAMELAFSNLIGRIPNSGKTWDAYLLLVCRSNLNEAQEFNQLSDLTYNTRLTRKVIHVGIGDTLTALNDVARPFVSLEKVQSSAVGHDPLGVLGQKMIESGFDASEITRLMTLFREQGSLGNN